VRGDAGELDAGVLEHLLQALDRARALVDLRLAQPRQIAQPADLRRRHEARPHQSVLHELADPFGVLDVGLSPGDVVQVVRVEQPALKALLERLKYGLPVHAGGLHPDQRHAGLGEPLGERRKPGERGAKGSRLLIPATPSGARDAHRCDHVVAVHVKTRAPLHQNIHRRAPSETTVYVSPGGGLPRMSLSYALEAAIKGSTGPRATLSHGL
jgi:hypothetical protein